MGVVRLLRSENFLAGSELAGNPERLEIRYRSTAAEVAQMRLPGKHAGQFSDCFFLHGRAGAATVERMVIWVEPEREGIGQAGDGVRRLKHLAGIKRVEIRIIIA